MSSIFLTAEWRKLIMAQYAVDPAILTPYLPRGLDLDFYRNDSNIDGSQSLCFVSLVGFLFDRVRLKGIPIPFHTRFEEVNLRFYVRRPMPDGTHHRGVVFISEIVPKPAITLVARALYGEAYSTAPTRHTWSTAGSTTNNTLDVRYDWKHRGHWQQLSVKTDAHPHPIAAGSMEEFITEHYWGYTRRRNGSTAEYGVRHPHWQIFPIHVATVAADFGSLYGPAFAHLTQRQPNHVLLAEGSAVSVRTGARIHDAQS